MRMFFQSVMKQLEIKNFISTAYYPQIKEQVKCFNKTIVTRVMHSVTEHQRRWDVLVQPSTYVYNT